mgnify:CR=1 FL=1
MGNNNLYKIENTLRSIAKRYKSVKYSLGLAILFLMMGVGAFSAEVNDPQVNGVPTREEIATSKENLRNSVGSLQSKIDSARAENEKGLTGLKLELIQLMEQGDQVVKSPWASWQFGLNYMYSDWRGTYKGRGDKAEKYPYEGVLTRDEGDNEINRYISPDSPFYSSLAKSSNPRSASTNARQGLRNQYGIGSTTVPREPLVDLELSAGITPRFVNKAALTLTPPAAVTPNLPTPISFKPATPTVPNIEPATVNIVTVTLSPYYNDAKTEQLTPTEKYKGSHTMNSINPVLSGSYTLNRGTPSENMRNNGPDKYGDGAQAIAEYVTQGSYTIDSGVTMNVNSGSKRAITIDSFYGHPNNWQNEHLTLTSKGTINLYAEKTGGIEVQSDPSQNEYWTGAPWEPYTRVSATGINEGTITGHGNKQVAMIFTDEGPTNKDGTINPDISYTLRNKATITMNGNQSTGFGLGVTSGWHAKAINDGTITLNGEQSYGIGLGKKNTDDNKDIKLGSKSSLQNLKTINVVGNNSGGIAIESKAYDVKNTGTINISGESSFGMYLSSGETFSNEGKINITGSKNKSVGMETNEANSKLINKDEINISSSGEQNIGLYTKSGTVVNEGTVNVTAGKNVGMFIDNGGKGKNDVGGTINVTSDGGFGLISSGATALLKNEGKLNVSNTTDGTVGMVASNGGTLTSTGTTKINIKGQNSVGVYSTSSGKLDISNAEITTGKGAFNVYKDGGNINFNGNNNKINVGQSSLGFYVKNGGKVNFAGTTTATIEGATGDNASNLRGTAFLYTGNNYSPFSTGVINSWIGDNFQGMNNLKLDMKPGSRLFIAQDVSMNLTDTNLSGLTGPSGALHGAILNGTDYKTFMLYLSKLALNQSIDLDSASDAYNKLEISNSSIDNNNNNTITGTKIEQTAMAQENDPTYARDKVKLVNNGIMSLTGDKSTGIYGKYAELSNTASGKITMGNSGTALYGKGDSLVTNAGAITLGSSSTGMYLEGATAAGTGPSNAKGKLENIGTITSTATKAIGMTYNGTGTGTTDVRAENKGAGNINLSGEGSVGIYGLGNNYMLRNSAGITLGNASSIANPNVGIFSSDASITTENTGTITGGHNSIGVYGNKVTNGANGKIKVGNTGIGVYSIGGGVDLLANSSITVGEGEAVGVYLENGGTVTNDGAMTIGDNSYGFVAKQGTNPFNFTSGAGANIALGKKSIYVYSSDTNGTITNHTALTSSADGENYGLYGAGTITNDANINFETGIGNVGVYSIKGGTATNTGTITVGGSDVANSKYALAMAAGYETSDSGNIVNNGILNVNGKSGIGMYATGANSTARNNGTINLNAAGAMGMYLDNGAKGFNSGTITSTGSAKGAVGIVVRNGATFTNEASGNIHIEDGYALFKATGGIIKNYGNITLGKNATQEFAPGSKPTGKEFGDVKISAPAGATKATITKGGKPVTPFTISNPIGQRKPMNTSIGLYVDTLRGTNPPQGTLPTGAADLIIGSEASQITNNKYIEVNGSLINPYNTAIRRNPQVTKWNIYSGALNWIATATMNANTGLIENVYLAKRPYTDFAGNEATPVDKKDTYNFLDGLEQRYDKNALDSREKQLFNKLNGIGKNEEILFHQAVDEMMGHQYANVQQRINATGKILDKEFDYLRSEWQTVSKDSNKIKVFGTRGEYKTDTAGVIDYKNHAYGVAYVHEDETIKLGKGTGWYTGIVHNTFKFKDIGKSKEEMLQAKLGVLKSVAFDDDNSLNWTISGDIFVGRNKMHRRYLVVDDIFNAKARYWTYGIGVKNELGKSFRLSEDFSLRPYAALNLEYGRVGKIRERSGEIRLNVKHNDYISVSPEVGAELAFKHFVNRKTIRVGLEVAYENELGRVAKGKNKARVAHTNADWFNIRGEKEDRRGNVKFDLNVGVDNQRVGVTVNAGYDTKGHNVRGGLGLRVIF